MKKILAIAVAFIMVMALSVSVFADEVLFTYDLNNNSPDGWWEESTLKDNSDFIEAILTDGAWIVLEIDASGAEGLQAGFQTHSGDWQTCVFKNESAIGDGDLFKYPVDNIVVDGDRAYVYVNGAAYYAAVEEFAAANNSDLNSWGWINGVGDGNTYSVSVVVLADNEAPADDAAEDDTTAPADDTAEPPAANEPTAPKTGLTLAVVPAVIALAAASVTKRR